MRLPYLAATCMVLLLCGRTVPAAPVTPEQLKQQVADTERAFAKTMVDRDLAGFARFVSEEAVFFSGAAPLRGRAAVVAGWTKLYEKPEPGFSWAPEEVEVLDSGNLALSSGPVYDPHGKLIARFTSIWRQEAPSVWRIIFDKGSEVCDCKQP